MRLLLTKDGVNLRDADVPAAVKTAEVSFATEVCQAATLVIKGTARP